MKTDILDGLTPKQQDTVKAFAHAVRTQSIDGVERLLGVSWVEKEGTTFFTNADYRIAPAPPKFKVGDRVKAFSHSTKGTVDQVDGSFALVKWDTGPMGVKNQNDLKPLKTIIRPWTPEEAEGKWVRLRVCDGTAWKVVSGEWKPSLQSLFERYVQLDGSPCGIQEEVEA